ncbi:mannose-6-phosphate isomerase, class I [Amorphoplanes digitatis]|uniref:mannose-6-phosphate isomerase n=1 Tax=Actinoplanes digitatis TaxID=1868 RepID=A0A7W7MU07_9ACTN|nr:mannose-6-phosphate isomerase, class I [Actinoplanes digitatis]MBB4766327.1 mannose-6-phosphate isomerase [Actinoplanes digitatis]GID96031.1 putative mannose-6-phosphate isomerase ManA [Actinoplanes digitatis]
MAAVFPLRGVVRPYAWGSRTSIAELQGRPSPSETPEAELWLGAHPGDPSTVTGPDGPVSLATLIEDDPKGQLGADVVDEFGARLPYLMKVLAAAAPLSLQAHPDADYAKRAYAAQEADPEAPRNYTDAHHKPEMLVALTPFDALCGFRAPDVSAALLADLNIPRLAPVVAALRAGPAGLRDAVRALLTWPAADRPALIDEVVAAARSAVPATRGHELAIDLAGHYPGDPGVLVALLLNHVRLAPGEAIWMPAGNLHAYLRGTGIEIMAASDNVLRGGLTPKRVDVEELLRVLRFEVLDDPILPATEVAPGVRTWQVPVREFALYRMTLTPTTPPLRLPGTGPRIVLGTRGDVFVAEAIDGTPAEVVPGTAAYVPAQTGPATVAGVGEIFVACPAT